MAIFNMMYNPTQRVKIFNIHIISAIDSGAQRYVKILNADETLKEHRSDSTARCSMFCNSPVDTSGGKTCYISSMQQNYKSDETVGHSGYSVRSTASTLARTGWSINTISGLDSDSTNATVSGILKIDADGNLYISYDGNYKILAGYYTIVFTW